MSRAFWPLVLSLVVLSAIPERADACSCVPMSSCQRYASSSTVFVADVLDVAEPVTPGPKTTRMRVVRVYKGGPTVGETVTVTMPRGSSASCSLDVAAGKRYVIFGGGEKGVYSTGLCHGSYSLKPDDPLPDLPPPAGRVTGVINRYHRGAPRGQEYTPIAAALVWIVTPDGRIEARTGSDGRFTMTGVPLGPRMVRSDTAPGERVEERIDLQFEGDCAEVFATPWPTGRLIGAVLDHTGKPVVGAQVFLRPVAEPAAWSRSGETGRSGSFDITKVDPGSYLVTVGTIGAPTTNYPYAPVFHPGVVDRQAAQTVTIGVETVRLPATRLQPPIELIPIVATIVCRDGTIPASAFLSAEQLPVAADRYGHKDFGSMATADGRSTIRVVRGHRYAIRGEVTVKEPMLDGGFGTYQLPTPSVEIDPEAPPPSLILRSELEKCAEPDGVTVPARR
jgi:hypothetical protein